MRIFTYLNYCVRIIVFVSIIGAALVATFQTPQLVARFYPGFEASNPGLQKSRANLDQLYADLKTKQTERAANDNKTERSVDTRNQIDGMLAVQIADIQRQIALEQKSYDAILAEAALVQSSVKEASGFIRMFGLGMLGALGGLSSAYGALRQPNFFRHRNFVPSMVGLVFGGFAGLVGYGLVATGQVRLPAADVQAAATNPTLYMIVICVIAGAFADFLYEVLKSWLHVFFGKGDKSEGTDGMTIGSATDRHTH